MFDNQSCPDFAICEDIYSNKKKKHKHHKHHKHHKEQSHMCGHQEHRNNECFRPASPSGPFNIAPGNNLFFVILITALIFFIKRGVPAA